MSENGEKVRFYVMGMLGKTIIGNILNIISFQYGLEYFMLMSFTKTIITAVFLSLFNNLTEYFSYRILIQIFSFINILTCSGILICINFYKYNLKEDSIFFLTMTAILFSQSYISRIFICNEMTSLAEESDVYEFYRAGNSLSYLLASLFSLLAFSFLDVSLDYKYIAIIMLTYESLLSSSILFFSSYYWKSGQFIYDKRKRDKLNLKWHYGNIFYVLYIYWEGIVTYVLYPISAYFYRNKLTSDKIMPILLLLSYDISDFIVKSISCVKRITIFERVTEKWKYFILLFKSFFGYAFVLVILIQNDILFKEYSEKFKSVFIDIFVLAFYAICGFGTGILDMYLTKEFLDRNDGCTKSASAYSAFADYMADFTMSAILSYYSYIHGL